MIGLLFVSLLVALTSSPRAAEAATEQTTSGSSSSEFNSGVNVCTNVAALTADPFPRLSTQLTAATASNGSLLFFNNLVSTSSQDQQLQYIVNLYATDSASLGDAPLFSYVSVFPQCLAVQVSNSSQTVIPATLVSGKSLLPLSDSLFFMGAPNLLSASELYSTETIINATSTPGRGSSFSAVEVVKLNKTDDGYISHSSILVTYDTPLMGLMLAGFEIDNATVVASFFDDTAMAVMEPADTAFRSSGLFNASSPTNSDAMIYFPDVSEIDLQMPEGVSNVGGSLLVESMAAASNYVAVAVTVYPDNTMTHSPQPASAFFSSSTSSAVINVNASFTSSTPLRRYNDRCYPFVLMYKRSAPGNWSLQYIQFLDSGRRTSTNKVADSLPCDHQRGRVHLSMDPKGGFVSFSVPSWATIGTINTTNATDNYRIRSDDAVAAGSLYTNLGSFLNVAYYQDEILPVINFGGDLALFFYRYAAFKAHSQTVNNTFDQSTGFSLENSILIQSEWNIPNHAQRLPTLQSIITSTGSCKFFAFLLTPSRSEETFLYILPKLTGGEEFSFQTQQISDRNRGSYAPAENLPFLPCNLVPPGNYAPNSSSSNYLPCSLGYYCPVSSVTELDPKLLINLTADLPDFEETFFSENFEDILVNYIFNINEVPIQLVIGLIAGAILFCILRFAHVVYRGKRYSYLHDILTIISLSSLVILRLFGYVTVSPHSHVKRVEKDRDQSDESEKEAVNRMLGNYAEEPNEQYDEQALPDDFDHDERIKNAEHGFSSAANIFDNQHQEEDVSKQQALILDGDNQLERSDIERKIAMAAMFKEDPASQEAFQKGRHELIHQTNSSASMTATNVSAVPSSTSTSSNAKDPYAHRHLAKASVPSPKAKANDPSLKRVPSPKEKANNRTFLRKIISRLLAIQIFLKLHRRNSFVRGFILLVVLILFISSFIFSIIYMMSYPTTYTLQQNTDSINRQIRTFQRSVGVSLYKDLEAGLAMLEMTPFSVIINMIGFTGTCNQGVITNIVVTGCKIEDSDMPCSDSENFVIIDHTSEEKSICSFVLTFDERVTIDAVFNLKFSFDIFYQFEAIEFAYVSNSEVTNPKPSENANYRIPSYNFSEVIQHEPKQTLDSINTLLDYAGKNKVFLPSTISRTWTRTVTAYSYQVGDMSDGNMNIQSDLYSVISSYDSIYFQDIDYLTFWTDQSLLRTISITVVADTQYIWNVATRLVQTSNTLFTMLLGMIGILHMSLLCETVYEVVHYILVKPTQNKLKGADVIGLHAQRPENVVHFSNMVALAANLRANKTNNISTSTSAAGRTDSLASENTSIASARRI